MTAATMDGLGMDLDLSASIRDLIRRVRETGRGVVLGDDGGQVAVVLSLGDFERLQAAAGRLLDHDEVMEKYRRCADE
ncbi:MAG: type II toxin-antitoxin system Phd/YefM family antitoxin [Polyangiaceae bacterium]|nr:type II toxin-antitoxin system Phd/YefM family antitoxin [Polyangiaceae bacterium]